VVRHRRFEPPIPLSSGRSLRTIGEAVAYIDRFPEAEQLTKEWQAAMLALKVVIDHDGPTMFARMGMMSALDRGVPPPIRWTGRTRRWRARN